MYDLAITGGGVLDGSGKPPFRADIGIRGDKIISLGSIPREAAREEIRAEGLLSCPGFIDTHSHSDLMALREPQLLPKIRQGITTELFGQDGIGAAPLDIAGGKAADLVVFNPETILDRATYEDPRKYPEGIHHVIVNGVHSVAMGEFTGKCGGRVLKRGGG